MSKKSEVIKEEKLKSEIEIELIRALKLNLEEYFNEARKIIKKLEKKVNEEFLVQIEVFIKYAKNQVENKNLSEETRLKYLDLIEEESLHDGIKEDLNRNNGLIESVKNSTDALFDD